MGIGNKYLVSFAREHSNNKYYSDSAEKLFENVDDALRKYIKSINIKFIEHAGECRITENVAGDEYEITITINDKIEGVDIIENYSADYLNKFNAVLDHELVHATTYAQLIRSGELNSIKHDKVSKLGWYILDEYNACRKIAERYNSFELGGKNRSMTSILKIGFNQIYNNLNCIFNNRELPQIAKKAALEDIEYVLYALATRCAFAAVSSVHKNLVSTEEQVQENFITKAQDLFEESYMEMPLSKEKYYVFGKSILLEYLAICPPISSLDFSKIIEENPEIEMRLLDVI